MEIDQCWKYHASRVAHPWIRASLPCRTCCHLSIAPCDGSDLTPLNIKCRDTGILAVIGLMIGMIDKLQRLLRNPKAVINQSIPTMAEYENDPDAYSRSCDCGYCYN